MLFLGLSVQEKMQLKVKAKSKDLTKRFLVKVKVELSSEVALVKEIEKEKWSRLSNK